MTDYQDEETDDQEARCRALEMAVLLRALLDATWSKKWAAKLESRQRRAEYRMAELRRLEARNWFLDKGRAHRAHINSIAEAAGLPHEWIWMLVDRYIVKGEDRTPLVEFQSMMSDLPGRKKFDFSVAFVA